MEKLRQLFESDYFYGGLILYGVFGNIVLAIINGFFPNIYLSLWCILNAIMVLTTIYRLKRMEEKDKMLRRVYGYFEEWENEKEREN